jgi:hypothetical protein
MMKAVEAVIEVSQEGSAVIDTRKQLKPGLHKILIIADENAISEGDWRIREKKRGLGLKPIHIQGWPMHSTFRREEIYNDDGR